MWLCLHLCIYFCSCCLRARDSVSECVCMCVFEGISTLRIWNSTVWRWGGRGALKHRHGNVQILLQDHNITENSALCAPSSPLHLFTCSRHPFCRILSLHLHQYTQCRSFGVTPSPSFAVCVVCRIGTEHTACLAALTYFQTLLWQLGQSSPPERPPFIPPLSGAVSPTLSYRMEL